MVLIGKRRVFVTSASLAAATVFLWSAGSTGISARTRTIGSDRIVSVESLPSGDACLFPDAESVSLPAAIAAMEALPGGTAPVCALPPHVSRQAASVRVGDPRPSLNRLRAPRFGEPRRSEAQAGQAPAAPSSAEVLARAEQRIVGGPGTRYQGRTRAGQIDKQPARYIKDPYAAWSAIAVNAENDMVIMTDENLFRIVEYSRRDNTPPNVPLTEPRRVIGGDKTRTEMMCGAYIDPKTLDVYVTNNDTQNWLPVFSREARDNAVPDRVLMTPHRTWGIAVDEIRQELFLTVEGPDAVVVYRKAAANNEAPLRLIEGDATELADPHGIAFDRKEDVIVTANHGNRRFHGGPAVSTLTTSWEEWIARQGDLNSIPRRLLPGLGAFEMPSLNIYARGASGNTPPLRVIKGPKTRLNWPSHVAVHEDRGEIFVANDADDSILVFRIADKGDVAPVRVIKGPRTQLKNPTGLSVDAKNGELWVASMGNYTGSAFPLTASGDVAPLRTIRGGPANRIGLMVGNPGAVGYDSRRQEILVPN